MYVVTGEKSYLYTDWKPDRKYTLAKFTDGNGKQWWQLAYRWGFWTYYLSRLREYDSGTILADGPLTFDSAEQAMAHLDREQKWLDRQTRAQQVSMDTIPQISVMSLKPNDILVFSTPDKLSLESYQRFEQKVIDWKRNSGINNTHLILTSSVDLKVLQPEKANDIANAIYGHLRTMAPHQLERLTAIQLREAADEIKRLRLTDEEREAVEWFAEYGDLQSEARRAETLKGLLVRLG